MSPDQRAQNVLKPHGNALAFVFGPRTERCGHEQTVAGHLLPIPHRTDTCSLPWRMPNSSEWGCNACAGDRPGSATSRAASTGLVHAWPCFLKPGSRAIFRLQIQQIQWSAAAWPARALLGHRPPSTSPLTPYPLPLTPCPLPLAPCHSRSACDALRKQRPPGLPTASRRQPSHSGLGAASGFRWRGRAGQACETP